MNFRTILAASLATAAGLFARADGNWRGSVDTDWNNAANWSSSKVGGKSYFYAEEVVNPVITFSADTENGNILSFQNGLLNPIVFSGPAGLSCNSTIYLGGGADGSLTVSNGTYALTGEWKVGQDSDAAKHWTGVYRQTGGSTTMGDFNGAYNAEARGELDLEGGSLVVTKTLNLGKGANSTCDCRVSGGSMLVNRLNAGVASGATGVLYVSDGELTITNGFYVGYSSDSIGKFYLSEAGRVNVKNKDLEVGTAYARSLGEVQITGGTLALEKDFKIGNKESSTGIVSVVAGTITATSVQIANDGSSVGSFEMSGGSVTLANSLNVAAKDNTVGSFRMTGGEFLAGGKGTSVGVGANAEASIDVSGGRLYVADNHLTLAQGTGSKADVRVSGTGVFESYKKPLTFKMADNSVATLTIAAGGTAILPQITTNGVGTGTSNVVFDGGTLKARSDNYQNVDNWLDPAEGISYKIAAGGAKFNTNGKDVTISAVLESAAADGEEDGGLVKEGEGALTLSAQPTYTGVTEVKAGTLALGESITLPHGIRYNRAGTIAYSGTTFPGPLVVPADQEFVYDPSITYQGIALESGAKMIINVKNYTSGMEMTLPSVTIPEGASMEDMVIINVGHRATISVRTDETTGKITATITDTTDAVTSRWTNVSEDGLWTTSSNWTFGVPASIDTAKVENGAIITGTINTTNEVSTLDVSGDVEIKSSDGYNGKEFTVKAGAVTGSGTLTLNRINLVATKSFSLPETIVLTAKSTRAKRISFLTGSVDAKVTIPGTVRFPSDGYANLNILRLVGCDITGTLMVDSYNEGDSYLYSGGANTLIDCSFSGKLTGSGHMLYQKSTIGGDFSEFTGMMVHNYKDDCTLVGPIDARKATWNFGQTTYFDVTKGGLFQFGSVTNTMYNRVFFPESTNDVTVEIGHLNQDMVLDKGVYAQAHDGNKELSNFTIRKVGTGTLTTDLYGVQYWEVTNGCLNFVEMPDGISTNAWSQKYINKITVSGTGKVTGSPRDGLVTEVKELVYDGVTFGLTVTKDGSTYASVMSNPIWTDSRIQETTLQGACAFAFDEATEAVLKSGKAGDTITLMTGTKLSSTATFADIVVAEKNGKPSRVWRPSVANNAVVLTCKEFGNFRLIIR